MIFLDSEFHELAEVEVDIDIEVGTTEGASNDFELTDVPMDDFDIAGIYMPGSEIGGLIEYVKDRTDQDYSIWRGYSWRGLMSKSILMPPAGSNYLIVSGEANDIIASLLNNRLGNIFTASTESSGLTITSYQFPLYINLADGIELMLESYGYRMKITAQKVAAGDPIQILVEAVPASLVAGTYNEDNGIPMTFELDDMGINHLICGGSGELQSRMIRHLYIGENGEVTTTQYYFGLNERQEFYDYGNAQSEADLIDNGIKRLLEISSHRTLTIEAPVDLDLDIGDIIQGTFPDGTVIRSPIVKKIFKIKGGTLKTEYKIKGEQ